MSLRHLRLSSCLWERARRLVFNRDGYRCQACGRPGRLECDHVQPLHKGGAAWDLANLQTLCRGCHIAKTQKENCPALRNPDAAKWRAFVDQLM